MDNLNQAPKEEPAEVPQTIAGRFYSAILHVAAIKQTNIKKICKDMPFTDSYVNLLRKKPNINLGAEFIAALHKAHNVSLKWLILGEGDMFADPTEEGKEDTLELILEGVNKVQRNQEGLIEKLIGEILKWNVTPTEVKQKLVHEVRKNNKLS